PLALAGCSSPAPAEPPAARIRIAAGEVGGVYHAYAKALAAEVNQVHPGLRTEVLATAASVANLHLLDTGGAEVAFSLADAASDAAAGRGRFQHEIDVVALARLYDNYVQLVVRAESAVRSLPDLRGQRVSTGAAGSGTSLVAGRLLDLVGLVAPRDVRSQPLGLAASVRAMQAGTIDGFFFSGGIPTPAVAELAVSTAIRVVPLAAYTADLTRQHGDLYSSATIPASAYGLGAPVPTVSVPNYLLVRRDLDERIAYALTRVLFVRAAQLRRGHPEARRLSPRSAIATYPLELHPGAIRWYREARQ
ncbi:MAG TPA: TAXI family TRAP transporter solute-binding subunit, partial [Cryptosporangiaceae bacterium]|nr:TAXI family TRAP transporter solute-binding subunit [Cryptosporangiaceae bacterium]